MSSISLTTLPSGLRIITDSVPSVESAVLGVWCDVGARHEDPRENGVAHMVEHMMFKGTPTRSAQAINETIENVGGSMNAWTSHENTAYHMHVLKEDAPLALDLLADMIQRPSMPAEEVERERGVILQEIGMYLDTPDDHVFDIWQQTAYPDQPLGAPVLGRSEIIKAMPRDTLLSYVRRFYTPRNMVVSVAGNVEHDAIVAQVEKLFTALPEDQFFAADKALYKGGEIREERAQLEQSHIILGFQGLDRHDADYYAAVMLALVLGGGTSSRLYNEIREKRGLVYSVFGYHHAYEDGGELVFYAGTGPEKLGELVPVLCDEIVKSRAPVSEDELARAKSQLKARLLMARESMMSCANQQAMHLIPFGEIIDIAEKRRKIDAVTIDDVARVAAKIFASVPTLAAVGPLDELESYESITRRLA